ncbi:MAG: phosphatidylserine decarboxylase family protein, partial [Runella slithyformis]
MTIHKEGYGLILGTAVAVLVSNLLLRQFAGDITWLTTLWLVASLIFFFIILQFFRKPTRTTVVNPNHI